MNFILPLRITQAILAVIVLGLAAGCISDITVGTYPEAAFLVFNSVWSIVVLGYLLLTPMFMPNLHNRWVVVGLEAVTVIFWFAGFIAMAASTDNIFCDGDCNVIDTAKAATAFAAFSWVAWCVTLGLIIHAVIQYRKGENVADPGNTTSSNAEVGKEEGAPGATSSTSSRFGHGDQDIEMHGGGQNQQSELKLPNPIHTNDSQHQTYGLPPSDSYGLMPDPTEYGGQQQHGN